MRYVQKMKSVLKYVLVFPIALVVFYFSSTSLKMLIGMLPMEKCSLQSGKLLNLDYSVDASLDLMYLEAYLMTFLNSSEYHFMLGVPVTYYIFTDMPEKVPDIKLAPQQSLKIVKVQRHTSSRQDVQTCTTWKAPVIWEGMFDPHLYDQMHQKAGSSVALTVFAVGRYLEAYLMNFLNSSEYHFMLGVPVTYYVFTDMPEKVPDIKLAPQRNLKIVKVQRHTRWQDISMLRMKTISDVIESDIRHHCTHVFCFDVDQVFTGRFGTEALGDTVALLHAHYYHLPKKLFTYDRNPKSKAYMETGDFYYHAAVFGGSWKSVKALTDACYQAIMEDKQNNVEALWHDESHLNKYLWLHKPSRVLSPEYCWDTSIGYRSDIRINRLLWAPKHYETLRTL